MAMTEKRNMNLMNLIKKVHSVVENTDIEKHRQSQDHFGSAWKQPGYAGP